MLKLAESKSKDDCLNEKIIPKGEKTSFKNSCKFILYNEDTRQILILLSKQKSQTWFDSFEFLDKKFRTPMLFGYTVENAVKGLKEGFESIFESLDYRKRLEDIAKKKRTILQTNQDVHLSDRKFLHDTCLLLLSGTCTLEELLLKIIKEKSATKSAVLGLKLKKLKFLETFGKSLLEKRTFEEDLTE